MNIIRLLIADDHPVVRNGLRGMLASQPDFDVVGEAEDGATAVRLAAELVPTVVLMDLRMPFMDGVRAIREIKATRHSLIQLLKVFEGRFIVSYLFRNLSEISSL